MSHSPASAPEKADNSKPSVPTPTWILLPSPNKFELLMKSEIVPAARSNTKNFVTANGSSRDTIGLNDSQRGLMSSACMPDSKDVAGVVDLDGAGEVESFFRLFCSYGCKSVRNYLSKKRDNGKMRTYNQVKEDFLNALRFYVAHTSNS